MGTLFSGAEYIPSFVFGKKRHSRISLIGETVFEDEQIKYQFLKQSPLVGGPDSLWTLRLRLLLRGYSLHHVCMTKKNVSMLAPQENGTHTYMRIHTHRTCTTHYATYTGGLTATAGFVGIVCLAASFLFEPALCTKHRGVFHRTDVRRLDPRPAWNGVQIK
jgi:hypothetical protein